MSEYCMYPLERVAVLIRRERIGWLAVCLSVAAGLLLCVAGLLLRWVWLCAGGLIVGAWAAYYLADTSLRPARESAAFARRMVNGVTHGFDGTWRTEDLSPVYVEGVRAWSVYCEQDGASRIFYVRQGQALPPVEAGARVHIDAVDRFILRFTVMDELNQNGGAFVKEQE